MKPNPSSPVLRPSSLDAVHRGERLSSARCTRCAHRNWAQNRSESSHSVTVAHSGLKFPFPLPEMAPGKLHGLSVSRFLCVIVVARDCDGLDAGSNGASMSLQKPGSKFHLSPRVAGCRWILGTWAWTSGMGAGPPRSHIRPDVWIPRPRAWSALSNSPLAPGNR